MKLNHVHLTVDDAPAVEPPSDRAQPLLPAGLSRAQAHPVADGYRLNAAGGEDIGSSPRTLSAVVATPSSSEPFHAPRSS
jgi:hypothetical protein